MYYQDASILGETLHPQFQPPPPKPKRSGFTSPQAFNAKIAPLKVQTLSSLPENGNVFDSLKPIYFVMRAVGIFPVANTEPGVFKMSPTWLGYSVAIFVVVVGFIAYIKWDNVEIVRSQEGRFEEAVIDYLFTVYLLPIIINPIVWYEARKLGKVVSDCIFFERVYARITKTKMEVFLGNKPLIITAVLPFVSCAIMVVTHLTMAHIKIVQVLPYCYINTVIYLISGFWFIQCDVIGKVATIVANDFQTTLRRTGCVSQVADYRSLWMLLSRLIRDVGNASGYTLTFICLYLFLIITLTIYGLLSQLQTGFSNKDIGLTINAAFAIAVLFFICDEAHYASNSVRVQFQKKLLLVELTWMKDEVQQEVNMFVRATEMSPTDMSLVGFFDVNRNLFKSLLATMVTYLVVLLQFQISIPEDNTPSNTNSTQILIATTTQSPK